MIVKIADKIGELHARFFNWVGDKAKTSVWFAVLLTLIALYEICEHILGPTIAFLWATGQLQLK